MKKTEKIKNDKTVKIENDGNKKRILIVVCICVWAAAIIAVSVLLLSKCEFNKGSAADTTAGTERPTVATEPLDVPFEGEGSVTGLSLTVITMDETGFKTREGSPINDATAAPVDGMHPTVLDAAKQIFDANGISYEMVDGKFTMIRGKEAKELDGYRYVWEFSINGSEYSFEYADSTLVNNDDQIVFYLKPYKIK